MLYYDGGESVYGYHPSNTRQLFFICPNLSVDEYLNVEKSSINRG